MRGHNGALKAAARIAGKKRLRDANKPAQTEKKGVAVVLNRVTDGGCLRRLCRRRLQGESRRQWLHYFLESSRAATIIDAMQILFSLVLVAFAINVSWDGPDNTDEPQWMTTVEIVLTVGFTVDYFAHLYAADDRGAFIMSFFAVIDVITILPVYFQIYVNNVDTADAGQLSQLQSNFLRPIRVLRALRILRAYRILSFSKNAVQRQIYMVLLTVISVIVCTSGIVQAVEYNEDPSDPDGQLLSFPDAMYFIVVTVTTVGFGDISPKSDYGRMSIMGMILASMILIPTQVSKLGALLSARSVYDGNYKQQGHPHVLVCGNPPAHTLVYFLHEFFNASSRLTSERIVILSSQPPSYEVMRLLSNPIYESRVSYFRGDAMLNSDLIRAKAHTARAAFVMLSSTQDDHEQLDTAASLLTSSIRLFTTRKFKQEIVHCPVFAQVMASSNVRHAQLAGASEVLGVQHLKYSLLARSCHVPGFGTFISNLLTSVNTGDVSHEPVWLQEYLHGAQSQIYAAPFPIGMHGMKFCHAAEIIKAELDAILIAVETGPVIVEEEEDEAFMTVPKMIKRQFTRRVAQSTHSLHRVKGSSQRIVRLCPLDYYVDGTQSDMAIMICSSALKADRISTLSAKTVRAYNIIANVFQSFTIHRQPQAFVLAADKPRSWQILKHQMLHHGVKTIHIALKEYRHMQQEKAKPTPKRASSAVNMGALAPARGAGMHMVVSRKRRVQSIRNHNMFDSDDSLSDALIMDRDQVPGQMHGHSPLANTHVGHMLAPLNVPKRTATLYSVREGEEEASDGDVDHSSNSLEGEGGGDGDGQAAAAGGDDDDGEVHVYQMEDSKEQPVPADIGKPPKHQTAASKAAGALVGGASDSTERKVGFSFDETKEGPSGAHTPTFDKIAKQHPSFASGSSGEVFGDYGNTSSGFMGASPVFEKSMLSSSQLHGARRRRRASIRTGTIFDPVPASLVSMGRESLNAAYTGFLHNTPPSNVHDHVICCGLPDSLGDFIDPLRELDMEDSETTVVIVSVRKPTVRSYGRIMEQRHVYYVHGSPRDPAALKEAGVFACRAVVVLSNPSRHEDDPLLPEEDLMVDADAMTTLRYILELTEKVRNPPKVVVELVRGSNIKFVNYRTQTGRAAGVGDDEDDLPSGHEDDGALQTGQLQRGSGDLDFVLRPAYASGQVVTAHVIEGLLGAAFHKPYVVRTTQLLLGTAGLDALGIMSAKAMHQPGKSHLSMTKVATPTVADKEKHPVLQIMDMPAFGLGRSFSQVFMRMLLTRSTVVVGVYRIGINSPAPYVYTNPPPDVMLSPSDRLLVLAPIESDV